MESSVLFEKYTIHEIRDIEKKTRQDIERKKEDLRQMVGERYRDLIEAADTIKEMKNSAENVNDSVVKMQDMCNNLKQSFQPTARGLSLRVKKENPTRQGKNQFYSIAVQIKLLLDMPEKIWHALEDCSFLQASQLFLLARHINTSLQSDSQQAAKIGTYFPVLARQWAAIGHFRTTILQITAECLCSILLLEDSHPRAVFSEFLAARTNAVRQLFQVNQSAVSIKSQVSDVVRMIATTVHQIYAIFFCDDSNEDVPNNLLMTLLDQVTQKSTAHVILGDGPPSTSRKYLSTEITEFRPVINGAAKAIPVSELCTSCQNWVKLYAFVVVLPSVGGLGKLLAFITTVKGLAAIRDEVWLLLSQEELMSSWSTVCASLLEQPLLLWQEFLCALFLERAQELLQSHVDAAYSASSSQVSRVLTELTSSEVAHSERNLSSYIWTESHQDIPANMAWVPVGAKTLADGGALMMKARAYTPAIQSLCRVLDHKLHVVLDDSCHYTQPSSEESSSSTLPSSLSASFSSVSGVQKEVNEPFDKYADKEVLHDFIKASCEKCILQLLQHLTQLLDDARQQLDTGPVALGNRIMIDRVLLLARFSNAVCELCPHFAQCMRPLDEPEARIHKKSSLRRPSPSTEDPKWIQTKTALQNFTNEAFSVWSRHTSQCLVAQFSAMVADNSGQALMLSSTRWNEISIEEETEEGEKVSSTIRVPMQASWYVQSLLYNLCEEINRIGGHSLSRANLQGLTEHLCEGLVQAYKRVLSEPEQDPSSLPLTQTRTLQLLFDFRFLTMVLPHRENIESTSSYRVACQEVIEGFESLVDPFDLDVFAPYIQGHLQQQTQKCHVLYGALTALDRHPSNAAMTSSTRSLGRGSQQEQHNILLLSSSQTRLPLLPISSHSTPHRPTAPSTVQPLKSKALTNASVSMQVPGSPPPTMPNQNQSFLGQMSTIWFSNVRK
ncbi:hypothetical protein CAPTEDRAFT_219346 [Capitella teleta]|uniref:Conserved oligomeric Golgi complex subunit 1 n=1 Tax=Capitella teleta TaxID=283909 RepID=R7UL72_CAPTE|nr:hypothetical protein CAPTEDRAFT_219346 [Capitella teleta]|eukprot:ELU03987.1 hypothetical protein CAPTEDRAFT_219346 [Capitella teleta]